MKTIENSNKLKEFIYNKFLNKELNNDSLVQIIELSGSLLNLQTISNYAKKNNISYNGVKNHRNIVRLFDVKFVIENE
jgi:hypothetical protein